MLNFEGARSSINTKQTVLCGCHTTKKMNEHDVKIHVSNKSRDNNLKGTDFLRIMTGANGGQQRRRAIYIMRGEVLLAPYCYSRAAHASLLGQRVVALVHIVNQAGSIQLIAARDTCFINACTEFVCSGAPPLSISLSPKLAKSQALRAR